MNKKTSVKDDKRPENFIIGAVKNSLIVRALSKLAQKIYKAAISSAFGTLLTSHDNAERKREQSRSEEVFSGSEKFLDSSKKIKHAFAKQFETSALVNLCATIQGKFMRFALSNYGVLFFSFGFYSIVVFIVKKFAFPTGNESYFDLAVCVAAIPIAIFLLVSKKSMAQALASSRIVGAVLFGLLGIRNESVEHEAEKEPQKFVGVPFIVGMALGVLSFFIKPIYIALFFALLIFAAAVFSSPEAGLVSLFLALPFAKTTYLAALVILIAVSFAIKFVCGRRTVKFQLLDIPIIMFMLMTLSGGVFSMGEGSLMRALVYVCFICGYFLVKMMFRSERYVRRAMYALALSSAIVAAIGIAEYFLGSPSAIWQDATLFADIRGRVVSTFDNPNVLGEFLIFTIPVTLTLFATAKTVAEKTVTLAAAVIDLGCLVLTWSRGAWLGLIIAGAFTLLFVSHKWLVAGILAAPAAAAGLMYAGSTVLSRLTSITNFSDSSTAYRIGIWKSALAMLKDTFFYGVGVGSGAFGAVFPYYAISGITKAEHAHSLYLQIAAETGVFTLIIFIVIAFFTVQKSLSFAKTAATKKNKLLAVGLLCGISAFLLMGFTDYVFYNYRICLLFWLMVGLSSAHIMSAKESSEENALSY